MKITLSAFTVVSLLALAACSSTGVTPMDKGTYLIANQLSSYCASSRRMRGR